MNFYSPLRIRIEKDVVVRINRKLKGKGQIIVSEGQEVQPGDLIGTAQVSSGFRNLNLSYLLNVSPKDLGKYLQKSLGQKIYKGELLAYKSSFLGGKKVIASPTDGILDFINSKTGEIRLSFLPKKEELPAGFYGVVDGVDPKKNEVMIRTQASLIHTMFGSGSVREGILRIIGKRDELITGSLISPKYDGNILLGGSLIFKDAIVSAISCGVNGIITGGINAKDYRGMAGGRLIFPKKLENDIGISIVVCEGFGSISIGEDIYEILAKHDGKYVSIDGNKRVIYLPSFEGKSMIRIRSTSLGLPKEQNLINYDEDTDQILQARVGVKVRIIGSSFPGEQGRLLYIDKTKTLLPSNVEAFMATVETKRRKIQVPVANLEIIL